MIGIYQITSKIDDEAYIGRSIDMERRKKEHIRKLNKGNHENKALQDAWDKYGQDNFDFELIKECNEKDLKYEELYEIFTSENKLYNAPSLKDQIIYLVSNYLNELNAQFEIDYKSEDCSNTRPLNFNLFAINAGKELYLSLRNMDFVSSPEQVDKYKSSNQIKENYVSDRNADLIEIEIKNNEDGTVTYSVD